MASIRKRNGLWQAQVRSRKVGSTSKSFHKKSDAVAWAKVQEVMMQTGEWKAKDKRYSTIGDLIQTYLFKATPNKKGAGPETRRLNRLLFITFRFPRFMGFYSVTNSALLGTPITNYVSDLSVSNF